MSHWNYRILKQENGLFGVHEVFYGSAWIEDGPNDPDKIAWTTDAVPEGLEAETLEELKNMVQHIYEDIQKQTVIDEAATLANDRKEVVYIE